VYHFPTYQPESKLERSVMDNLRETFRSQPILFDLGSSRIKPQEEPKLGLLSNAIVNAGPELHVVVAGYADLVGEPGKANKSLPRARAEIVRTKLIELGIAADSLEAMPLDAVAPPGPLTEEARRNSRSVELLIK
jgi:outer membrane protein OmpA-like peptidoglycan-associated protein